MNKLSEKIVSTLKSNTYNSVYNNTLAKLPIVVTKEGTLDGINGHVYPTNGDKKYSDGVNLITDEILDNYTLSEPFYYHSSTNAPTSIGSSSPLNNITTLITLSGSGRMVSGIFVSISSIVANLI